MREAYSAGVGCVVQTMFGRLISETGDQGESTWLASQLSSSTQQWSLLDAVPQATTTTLGVFAWQQRVAAVVQQRFETNWFGPRSVKLVLCHPEDPTGTRQVYDLGRWQTINYVNHYQGALFLGGSYFAPGDASFPSGKGLVVDLSATQPRLQRLTGDAHTPLASAPKLSGANHDACLALGGLNRVFLIPNPAGATPLSDDAPQPPRVLRPLQPAHVAVGAAHTFQIRASGTAPMGFSWLKDGTALPGRTGPSLEVVDAKSADGGIYSIVVSNAAGTITNSALLTIDSEALRIVVQPDDAGRLLGQSVTFCRANPGRHHPGFPVVSPGATPGRCYSGAVDSFQPHLGRSRGLFCSSQSRLDHRAESHSHAGSH